MQLFKKTITHAEAAARRKARLQALGGVGSEQHAAAVEGVHRFAARFAAAGDPATGAELKALADRAGRLLDERDEARRECAALNVDHIGDAVKAAANELTKKLSACFPCMADAIQYAEKLPMSQARAAAVAQSNAKNALSTKATETHRELASVLERAGKLALGDLINSTSSLYELALLGAK